MVITRSPRGKHLAPSLNRSLLAACPPSSATLRRQRHLSAMILATSDSALAHAKASSASQSSRITQPQRPASPSGKPENVGASESTPPRQPQASDHQARQERSTQRVKERRDRALWINGAPIGPARRARRASTTHPPPTSRGTARQDHALHRPGASSDRRAAAYHHPRAASAPPSD